MIDTLEEVHRATMMNPRAAELYGHLCPPGNKLCVLAWDSWPLHIEKPTNHRNQKGSWCTKDHGNSFSCLEACDLEGKPVFCLCLSNSVSPRCTDESMCYYTLELENVAGLDGGLTAMLVGFAGYTMVHLFDNGFRYINILLCSVLVKTISMSIPN